MHAERVGIMVLPVEFLIFARQIEAALHQCDDHAMTENIARKVQVIRRVDGDLRREFEWAGVWVAKGSGL